MNTGASWPSPPQARARVLGIQAKLHHWAKDDATRRFDDLYNLVCDPAFLVVAWERVKGNKGARTAGVDGQKAEHIGRYGKAEFLSQIRDQLKARTFAPLPVRERLIPKPGTTKRRRLGIPTLCDRVVQASLKLVLEPIFEADFRPCSYGFRPNRRAQDAISEIHLFATSGYEWVLDADIKACFDEISHLGLMDRVRARVGDRRVRGLVKAFLKAGILTELGYQEPTATGTPQGGIMTPPTRVAIWGRVSAGGGDAVADDHTVGADEDLADDRAEDALAVFDAGAACGVTQAAQEACEVFARA